MLTKIKTLIVLTIFYTALIFPVDLNSQSLPYLGQTPPGNTPVRLVPNNLAANSAWQYHGTPTFSPDGNEMYYAIYRYNPGRVEIWFTENVNGTWSVPQRAPFSNNSYTDNCPIFSRDKDTLYFLSSRPGGFIFRVTRSNGVWSVPAALNLAMPTGYSSGLQFSIADNGNIYAEMSKDGNEDLYIWRYNNGQYLAPEKLTAICSSVLDFTPFIDPAERFIMFASRRPGGFGTTDIYISKRNQDDTWADPINLGQTINSGEVISPVISRDGKYFFFEAWMPNAAGGNPYWVDASIVYNLITNINEDKTNPSGFKLDQNYPNPFNPETSIRYSVHQTARVTLTVHDLLGRETAVLVNDIQSPGSYEVDFNAEDLASGLYFYKLSSGSSYAVKKMLLMK